MLQSAPLADASMHTGGGRACGEREGAQRGYSGAHAAEAADEVGNGLRLRRMEDLELLDMRPEGKSSVRRHGMMRGDEISADMSMWDEGNNIVARIGMCCCCIVLYRMLSYSYHITQHVNNVEAVF